MKRLIRPGDRSDEVADVQSRLRALGYTVDADGGFFGDATRKAVQAFQQSRSMLVDGIVGPQTWNALVEASWRLGDRTLYLKQPFMRGDDVAALQRSLNALGFDAGREDGIFGPLAYEAVRAFQKEYGLPEDGLFGQSTSRALEGLRVDRPGTAAELREELRHRSAKGLDGSLVMIDPGHGGNDPGEIGPTLAKESEICWALATQIATGLAAFGARVRLTRNEPADPDDSDRAALANDLDADLFLSLHLNSNEEPTAEGTSAYFFGGSRAGEALAEAIHRQLVGLGARDCRVHARSFAVLKETRMPAVLVEPAFITNPDECKMLEDRMHRAAVAEAIVRGVRDFYDSAE